MITATMWLSLVRVERAYALRLGWLKPDLADQKLGRGLNDCLLFHGLPEHVNPKKRDMQHLSAAGGPFDAATMRTLIEYCTEDVGGPLRCTRNSSPR